MSLLPGAHIKYGKNDMRIRYKRIPEETEVLGGGRRALNKEIFRATEWPKQYGFQVI